MRARARRGLILAVMVAVLPIVSLSVMALGCKSVETLNMAARRAYELQAFYAADAGVQAGLAQLKADPLWTAGLPRQALPGLDDRFYAVTVVNDNVGTPPMLAADGFTVLPWDVGITSVGTATAGATERATVTARRGSVFSKAIFGYVEVRIGGTSDVDSYDSSAGPYAPPLSDQKDAEVGTNGTGAGAVTVFGASSVDGNVTVGPGADPTTAVVDTAHITGTAYAADEPFPLREVDCPISGTGVDQANPPSLSPGVYGSLTVTPTKTCTLGSGTYLFHGDVRISGTLIITPLDGPCIIYLDGSWDSSSASLVSTTSQQSWNLQIYGLSGCTRVDFRATSQSYLVMYAPSADITVTGSADVYGSLIGRTVKLNGTGNMHYDRQLALSATGPVLWNMLSYLRD